MVELLDISISKKKPEARKPSSGSIVRTFEDGLVEIQVTEKRRIRTNIYQCIECEAAKLERDFEYRGCVDGFSGHGLQIKMCLDCYLAEARRARDIEVDKRRRAKGRFLFDIDEMGAARRRMAAMVLASPIWRNRSAIRSIYAEARQRTEETGVQHDVDHIYPIMGNMGCGLHVPANLRVLKASENRSKGAGFPLSESPAWNGCSLAEIRLEYEIMFEDFSRSQKGY